MSDQTGHTPNIVTDDPDAIDNSHRLIASDRVEGTKVYGQDGDGIGSIHNFMVDKLTGKVSYAVMSFGGFLGLGEKYHPLPWDKLTYDENLGGYVVNLTREQLENAPSYARNEDPWQDPAYGRHIYGHYGMLYI